MQLKSLVLGKDHKNLLNNLEQIRRSAGFTQKELSESAEVSRKSINAIHLCFHCPRFENC